MMHHPLFYLFLVFSSALAVTQLCLGQGHVCALLSTAEVRCWGRNDHGQLGVNSTRDVGRVYSDMPPRTTLWGVVQISCGFIHTCALRNDSTLWCWGGDVWGQLGVGDTTDRLSPVPIALPPVQTVGCGYGHTCVLLVGSTVRCWGRGGEGQLGYESNNSLSTPLNVGVDYALPAAGNASSLHVGGYHTCVSLFSGQVKCWGLNVDGQLALSNVNPPYNQIGDQPGEMPPYDALLTAVGSLPTAGARHTCWRQTDGRYSCTGHGLNGALGYGNTQNQGDSAFDTPAPLHPSIVLEVQAHDDLTCLRLNSTIGCFGANLYGELGNNRTGSYGTTTGQNVPLVVAIDSPVIGLARGAVASRSMCVVAAVDAQRTTQGVIYCWGDNSYGQLGRPGTDALPPPRVRVSCGDGILQLGEGEQCDDGPLLPTEDCDIRCQIIKITPLDCQPPRPVPAANCIEGTWYYDQTLHNGGTLVVANDLDIVGDFVQSANATLTVDAAFQIHVNGCAYLDGTLNVTGKIDKPRTILTSRCINGAFSEILSNQPCVNLEQEITSNSVLLTPVDRCTRQGIRTAILAGIVGSVVLFCLFVTVGMIMLYRKRRCAKFFRNGE